MKHAKLLLAPLAVTCCLGGSAVAEEREGFWLGLYGTLTDVKQVIFNGGDARVRAFYSFSGVSTMCPDGRAIPVTARCDTYQRPPMGATAIQAQDLDGNSSGTDDDVDNDRDDDTDTDSDG